MEERREGESDNHCTGDGSRALERSIATVQGYLSC